MRKIFLSMILIVCLLISCSCITAVPEDNQIQSDNEKGTSDSVNNTANQTNSPSQNSYKGELYGLKVKTLDGKTLDNPFCDGNLVMINVWATWCAPCIEELPALDKLSRENEQMGVKIYGVLFDSDSDGAIENAKNILQKNAVSYPQLVLDEQLKEKLIDAYDVTALPTTFFVDPDGNIMSTEVGANEYTEWQTLIDKVIG